MVLQNFIYDLILDFYGITLFLLLLFYRYLYFIDIVYVLRVSRLLGVKSL